MVIELVEIMKKIVFLLFTSVLFLTSCIVIKVGGDIDNAIKGNGDIVRQERTVSGFYGLTINGAADVNVQTGENYKVVVATDNNLQEFVFVDIKDNFLQINTKSNIKPTRLMIDVYLPKLQSINLNGVGNVKLSNGKASSLELSLSGVGNIDAENYQVENITMKQSGVGNSKIWATNSLTGTLSGVGNIHYKGNPMVSVKVS